jgi:hypothetical protein
MKTQSNRFLLRRRRGRFFRAPAAAALAWLLLASSAPAAAQTPCAGPGWGQVSIAAYDFSYLSRILGRGANASALYCVRNNHSSRGVFVDWQGAALRSPIPPGKTIFQANPLAGRTASRRRLRLFYGARPNEISVMTLARAAAPLWDLARRAAGGAFRRAFYWKAAPAVPGGSNSSLIYVPAGSDFFADRTLEHVQSRPISPDIIDWLEDHPDQLGAFGMTFDNDVAIDARGRRNVTWKCAYRLIDLPDQGRSILLYLRFTDPDLHRRMFGSAEPFVIDEWWEERDKEFTVALPPLEARRIEARTAQLQILLNDKRTVIGSIPVTYSAPRGS